MRLLSRIYLIALVVLAGYLSSCQKDQAVPDKTADNSIEAVDSAKGSPANFLAVKGKLTVTLPDTAYTFDASVDSIAFINLTLKGQQYYGLTAINKAHTMSFGISSFGTAAKGVAGTVAGSQLLLSSPGKTNVEYTLNQNTLPKDLGLISIDRYAQDSTIAKGTFKTFLSKENKPNSTFYKVEGSFELKK